MSWEFGEDQGGGREGLQARVAARDLDDCYRQNKRIENRFSFLYSSGSRGNITVFFLSPTYWQQKIAGAAISVDSCCYFVEDKMRSSFNLVMKKRKVVVSIRFAGGESVVVA